MASLARASSAWTVLDRMQEGLLDAAVLSLRLFHWLSATF